MITTVSGFVTRVKQTHNTWGEPTYVWFRGEPKSSLPLLPKLYRAKPGGDRHEENKLLQMFRMRAQSYSQNPVPIRENIDQWLFLAQHVGLPTRLLDWTENSLLALHFSLKCDEPIVWMIDPIKLNSLSAERTKDRRLAKMDEFPLTWYRPKGGVINIGHENIRAAWERDRRGVDLPVAVHPTYLHPRMSAQRSVFSVHGRLKLPIPDLIPKHFLVSLEISPSHKRGLERELRTLGVQEASAFPDLDGLARELASLY